MRPDMTGALDAFDEMVEALEENEDMVECKECFDLFPKADCEKSEVGYVCPVCKGLRAAPARTEFVDPYDCYTQDFPEVADYNPDSVVDYEREPDLGDALSDLIKDEYEAIDGYEIADETIQKADIEEEDKDEILDTLEHIKEEEEEHIEELTELAEPTEEERATEKKDADEPVQESVEANGAHENIVFFANEIDAHFNKKYKIEILDGYKVHLIDETKDMTTEINSVKNIAANNLEADTEKLSDGTYVYMLKKKATATAESLTEDAAEDSEDNENEEVLDLNSAYEAALEIANETGVGQVFGYAKKDTEEFVAIDLLEVDDPEAIEQDLEAVYDDMGYAYVAFPEKTLEESLFESAPLHEAGFLTNLFTKENQNLDAFFTGGYAVKVGNSTVQTLQNWADAEKLATQKSKANPKEAVSVSAVKVSADELKNAGWSAQLVNEFGGKDFVIATYRGGKATLVDKAGALAKRLKAEIKSNKIMNKAGASSSEYNDQYGRISISDAFKDSKVVPTAATVVKLTNILFDKYTVFQGVAHPTSDEAKSSGSDIQITEVKALGEFEDLETAVKTAAAKSSRVQEEGSGDAPVAEVYGQFKDFDAEILTYLEKYLTRSPIGALDTAKSAGGPVHLFTYSMGKAIQDEGCVSLSKIIKYEKNILEDLEEAGIDVSGEPGVKPPKKDETSDEEDTDLDLEGESEGDTPKDPKEKLKAVLGDKKDPAGYTAESYAKYEALYEKVVAWIEGLKKPEAVTDEKIEGYKATAESKLVEDPDAGDADLDLEGESEETTDSETEADGDAESEETGDKSGERGSAEFNKKYHGVNVANTAIQAFRKLMMLTSMKVYDAMGNEVTTDVAGAKKITAETLNDFEVEVKGERQSLAAWISKMVKVGALHESFGQIFKTQLTEADKTQKTSEKDYLKDKGITDAALSSFKKLFALTDLKVYDAFDKPVPADKEGMTKMSSYTLVDFTVEYKGKKIPLIQFVAKLAKEKILKESLYKALKESTDLEDAGAALQTAAKRLSNMKSAMHEEYHRYANPAELAAMEKIEIMVTDALSHVYNDLTDWGYTAEEVDGQSFMCSENEACLQYMIVFENLDPDEAEDLAEQIQNTLENIAKDYKCPAEILGIDVSVALPDYDLEDEDDAAHGITRASFLFYITFARNLF